MQLLCSFILGMRIDITIKEVLFLLGCLVLAFVFSFIQKKIRICRKCHIRGGVLEIKLYKNPGGKFVVKTLRKFIVPKLSKKTSLSNTMLQYFYCENCHESFNGREIKIEQTAKASRSKVVKHFSDEELQQVLAEANP